MKSYECIVSWFNDEIGAKTHKIVTFGENYTDVMRKIESYYNNLLISVQIVEIGSTDFYYWDETSNFKY